MRRIDRDQLYHWIYVKLRTMPKGVKRGYASKLPHEADDATAKLAEAVTDMIEDGHMRLIAPDMILTQYHGKQPGKWGPDDPDPTENGDDQD